MSGPALSFDGAATLAGSSPAVTLEQLRINVTSPGGTTEQGIDSMRKDGVDAAMKRAMEAAVKRSIELSRVLGDGE